MSGKIFIGNTDVAVFNLVPTNFQHTFLFYDGDGNINTTNDQFIIQGYPSSLNPLTDTLVVLKNQYAGLETYTDLDSNNDGQADLTPAQIGITLVDISDRFAQPDLTWGQLKTNAEKLGSEEGGYINTGRDYNAFTFNCNTLTNTLLTTVGASLYSTLINVRLRDVPGYNTILDANSDGQYTISGLKGAPVVFYDGAGNDVLNLKEDASVIILNDGNNGSNTLVLEDFDPELSLVRQDVSDLVIYKFENGEYILKAILKDHFSSEGPSTDTLVFRSNGVDVTINTTEINSGDLTGFIPRSILTWALNAAGQYGFLETGRIDPLMIDLDGDGFAINASQNNDVYFDLDNDSFAEATSWMADSGDGFLVRDLNANGRIDSIAEMFGSQTVDGFTALRAFDSNGDGFINSTDSVWSTLKIWKDENLDGQTLASELHTLASLGITSIDVRASSINTTDIHLTNWRGDITDTSTVTTSFGTLAIGNANFIVDQRNSDYVESYTVDPATYALPDKRGYNNLMSLRDALNVNTSDDTGVADNVDTLREKIESLAVQDIGTFFSNYSANAALFERAMFQWAGVVNIAANSRGQYLSDARIVEFMEEFFGNNYIAQDTLTANPGAVQAQGLVDLWYGRYAVGQNGILQNMKMGIFAQMAPGALFDNAYYDYSSDTLKMTDNGLLHFNAEALSTLQDAAASLSTAALQQDFWISVIDFLRSTSIYANGISTQYDNYIRLDQPELTALDNAIKASTGNTHTLASIEYRHQNPLGDTLQGTSGNDDYSESGSPVAGTIHDDTIYGNAGRDIIHGNDGNDTIYANTSDVSVSDGQLDWLMGGNGKDTLYADASGDLLEGGAGSDHLIGNVGNDYLTDNGNEQNLLEGRAGNDFYYTHNSFLPLNGADLYISDTSGVDTFAPGLGAYSNNGSITEFTSKYFLLQNMTFTRFGSDDLKIVGTGSGTGFAVTIENQFNHLSESSGEGVEFLKFWSDSSTINVINLKDYLSNYTGTIQTNGTVGDDVINGILTGSANDLILAGLGNDIIHGDFGNDYIDGQDGNDTIYGDSGNDTIIGGTGVNYIEGGSGTDTIYGNDGVDTIYGGDGDDYIEDTSNTTGDKIYGGDGNDTILISGQKTIDGGAGNDTITATNTFNNTYIFSGGADVITDQGGATDVLAFASGITPNNISRPVQVAGTNDLLITITGSISGSVTIKNFFVGNGNKIEELQFSDGFSIRLDRDSYGFWEVDTSGNDTRTLSANTMSHMIASAGNDTIIGADDRSIIYGGDGDDVITGNYGDDRLHGGSGNDSVSGNGDNDQIWGGDGDDLLDGGIGNNIIDGGTGIDTLTYMNAISAVTINLLISTAQNTFGTIYDTVSNIENVIGSAFNDTLTGGTDANVFSGLAGNDIIDGGAGNDTIDGGLGDDTMFGGTGIDTLSYASIPTAGITVNLSLTGAQNTVNAGLDTLAGFENLTGSEQSDTLTGDAGANTINGLNGNDTIDGGLGDDIMNGGLGTNTLSYASATGGITINLGLATQQNTGGSGYDTISNFSHVNGSIYNDIISGTTGTNNLKGGAGDDFIYGNGGTDTIEGGAGNDTMVASGTGTATVSYSTATSAVTVNLAITSIQNTGGAGNDTISGFKNLTGSSYADTLIGDGNANTVSGGNGTDIIIGAGGVDTLSGGANADKFVFNAETLGSVDSITDFSVTTGQKDIIELRSILQGYVAGTSLITDFVEISTSGTTSVLKIDVDGGANNFVQIATLQNITGLTDEIALLSAGQIIVTSSDIFGTSGNDTISGTASGDIIHGLVGNDTLNGLDGNDTLYGDEGNDILEGGLGNDTLNGGADIDTVSYSTAGAGVTVDLAYAGSQNTNGADFDTLTSMENIIGSAYDDILAGSSGDNTLDGGSGNDTVSYRSATAAVTINLTLVSAQATGGAGTDTIIGFENFLGGDYGNSVTGNTGNNVIEGGSSNDTLNGGNGNDTLSYAHATAGITVSLATGLLQNTGGAGSDTVSNFENLMGSAYNDNLTGNSLSNIIDGNDGDDVIIGGAANDTLIGGNGNDTASYTDATGAVTVSLAITSSQSVGGNRGVDTINGVENLIGSTSYGDSLTGDASANTIDGRGGADTIVGGAGNDKLIGGAGIDILTGGLDADTFYFDTATLTSTKDTITDFSIAQGDKLDISSILVGYDPLTSLIDNFITFTTSGANTIASIDRDGTGAAYASVQIATITGVTGLDADTMLTNGTLIA